MKVGIIGYQGFVGSAFESVWGKKHDVTGISRENCKGAMGKEFDILINANGNSSKRLADSDPSKDFEMNVSATLQFLLDFPCRHYIHLSSSEVYNDLGSREKTREDAKITPSLLSNYGFSKYCGELAARKFSKSCLVLRLAGMVGPGMKKGPFYDIVALKKLFISPRSSLQFMDTREVASIAEKLAEKEKWGETYNVVGKGSVQLSSIAALAGVGLESEGEEVVSFDVSTEKLGKEIPVMASEEAAKRFIAEWKKGKGLA